MEIFEMPQKDPSSGEQIEFVQKKQHEEKFLGKQRRIAGLTMFSYNIATGEIKIAPVSNEVAVDFKLGIPVRTHKLLIEKNCIYRQALNKKSFVKRLVREGVRIKNYQ